MAEEVVKSPKTPASPFPKEFLNPNGKDKWDPTKYERFALYVFLYNYIRDNLRDFAPYPDNNTGVIQPSKFKDDAGNYINFGLTTSALSNEIDDVIRKYYDFFAKKFKFDDPISAGGVDLGISKNTFLRELDDYIAQSSFFMGTGKLQGSKDSDGLHLSNSDALNVLRAKEDDVREYFNNVRKSVEGKPGNIDPETGKPKGGYLVKDVTMAEQERKEKLSQIAEQSGSTVVKALFAAGGLGLAVLSSLTLFSVAGVAVGSIAGSIPFIAGPVGQAIISVVGMVTGFKIGTHNLKEMLTSIGKNVRDTIDYFNFIHGIGKYAPQNGIPKGYNARIFRYNKECELKKFMINFEIPDDSSLFEKKFSEYVENFKKNAKYLTAKEIDDATKDVKFNYMVSNSNSHFGRVRALMAKNVSNELVNYSLKNPEEIEKIYTRLQKNNPNLEEVRIQLRDFTSTKSQFEKAGVIERYNGIMDEYAKIVLDAIDRTAFDDAYNTKTISQLNNAVKDEFVGERIKNGKLGNKEGKIKNTIKFIEQEGKHQTINADLKVNIGRQLNFTASSIMAACSDPAFGPISGITAGNIPKISDYIERVSQYGEDVIISGIPFNHTTISGMISAIESDNKTVYNYLKFMFDRKIESIPLNNDDIEKAIKEGYDGNLDAVDAGEIKSTCRDNLDKITNVALLNNIESIAIEILSNISSSSSDPQINSIEEKIKKIPDEDYKTKEYLTYILYKQAGRTGTKNYFKNEIAKLNIESLKTDEPSRLKKEILSSSMPTVVKANAVKALNDQITRLEEQSRREINAKVIDCIKANSFSGFEDIMKEIEAITFDSFDKEPEGIRQKLYEERIVSIQPPEVSEYLKLQLREKIENVIMQEINNKSQDLTTKAGSLEKNAEYLKKISTYSLLTSAQKDRIIAKISTYLEKSFEITLRNMETNILENVGKEKDDLTETLRKYKEKSYAEGGFATLFETDKTPEMDKISKRIDNLLFNSGIRDWIVPDAYYASKQHTKVIDMNSNDTKFIVAAYFKDPEKGRSDDDKLTVALTEIHTQYENLNTKISADGKNKDFLVKMDEIKSNNVDIIKSDADRVAALMSMKKHILEMYKKQVYLFFGEPYNPNEAEIHAKYDDLKFKEMSKPWITRLTKIDEECQKFLKSEEIRKSKTLSIYKNYQSAVKTIELLYNEPKEIVKLITQNQQNQPNR